MCPYWMTDFFYKQFSKVNVYLFLRLCISLHLLVAQSMKT